MTLNTELMSEAVVAGYVRDVSTRHTAPRPLRSHGRPARPAPARSRGAQAPIAGTRQHHRLRPRPRVELHAEQPPALVVCVGEDAIELRPRHREPLGEPRQRNAPARVLDLPQGLQRD